ncbi:MAG TPA: CHASE3 domain-containing protein [Polyangia bacterium]|nr:CHASE3 domain-containing protein [Polyangia bacterium]
MFTAAVLLALFVTDLVSIGGIISSRGWISRTQRTQALIDSVRAELLDAETGERDFFMTGRTEYRDAYEAATRALPATLAELGRLTSDDAVQVRNADSLASLVGQKLAELRTTLDLHRRMEIARALDLVRSDEAATLSSWIRQLIAEMRAREDARQQERTLAARRNLDTALWIDIAALAGLMILGTILFAINRDIGRRAALEDALRREAALQERFIAILGHDLRNPLNAVSMAARRLKEADTSPRWAKSVDYVIAGARRMTRLVDQLLDLARARQAGGIPARPRPGMDLGVIVRTVIDELCAANPSAEIVVHSEEPIPGMWDPDRLAQVVSNLVGNAIVHGTGRVEVCVKRIGGHAILEVRNGGQPIPADTLPRIFEAFQRPADGDGILHAGGLGLGLFIAERIVAAHRGQIAVSSNAEEGTTFVVTMPAFPAQAAALCANEPARASARLAIG